LTKFESAYFERAAQMTLLFFLNSFFVLDFCVACDTVIKCCVGEEAAMTGEGLTWESFAWRSGAEDYRFEIKDSGLIGTLSVSDGRKFALPVIVWEAMFEAVKTNKKAKAKAYVNLPERHGARWSDQESDELAVKFKTGRSIDDLAREHGRSVWGIEGQLGKLGLWDRIERRRVA
jgi:hypothetical protein